MLTILHAEQAFLFGIGFFSFGRSGMNGIVRSMRFTSLHQAVERPSSWQQDRFCPITRRLIEALEKCSAARLSATGTPSKRQQVHLFDWQPRSQTDKRRAKPLNLVLSWNVERKPIRRAVTSLRQRTNDAIAPYRTLPRSIRCSKSMLPSSLSRSALRVCNTPRNGLAIRSLRQ
jgi:hypothetical protein